MAEDLRVLKTRENIQSHFISLLNDYPFQDITIQMLITNCKINRSTFYRNYKDKYDLLEKISNDLLENYKKTIHPEVISLHPELSQNLRMHLSPLVDFFDQNREILLALDKNYIPFPLFDNMREAMNSVFLKELYASYPIREMEKAAYYLSIITGNILTTMKWWHSVCPELSKQQVLDVLVTCITKGLFFSMKELI